MDSLLLYLMLDVLVVGMVILVMFRRMSFWHPLTAYLLFHLYSFSYRAFKIYTGSPLMFTGTPNAEPITVDEINRAMLLADLALLIFAASSLWAHRVFEAKAFQPKVRVVMNPQIARLVGFLSLPIGAFFFFGLRSGGLEITSEDIAAGYAQVISMWPIGALGLLVFVFGFRWYLVILVAFFLGSVALQGFNRFMLILPLLFFTAYYLQSRRRRWPTVPILIGAVVMGLLFPRLKYIGQALKYGDTEDAVSHFTQAFSFKAKDKAEELTEEFLDQFAGGLTLTDYNGRYFNGSTYLAIITLPIPRAMWPNKPGLADHLQEISTSGRNYAQQGRILTYLGESYLNFGYAGLFLIPALLGYLLTAYCVSATSGPLQRLPRYVYLVVFMVLIQTFRDGLLSILVFTVVHNMPMLFTVTLHKIPGFAVKSLDRPPADPQSGEEEDIAAEEARRLEGPDSGNVS